MPPPPGGAPVTSKALPGPPLDVAAILDWTWRTYRRRAGTLLTLTVLLVAPVAVASGALGGNAAGASPGFSLGVLLFPLGNDTLAMAVGVVDLLILQPIYLVAIYRLTSGIYLGDPPGTAFLLRQGVRRFPSMLWVNVWLAIAFLAVAVIGVAISLVLGIILSLASTPSQVGTVLTVGLLVLSIFLLLYFFTRLQLSNAVYVAEDLRGRSAIGRSWLLTERRFWRCLGVFVSAAFLGGVVNFALGTIARRLTGIGFADGNALTGAAVALGQLFTAPFMALVTTAVLFAARGQSEPLDHASALAALKANDR